MTPKGVRNRKIIIETRIKKLSEEMQELQNTCTHPDLEIKHGSNTGNYDPSADCYWKTYSCPDCGKRWTEYSE